MCVWYGFAVFREWCIVYTCMCVLIHKHVLCIQYIYNKGIAPVHLHRLLVQLECLVEGLAGVEHSREQEVQQTKGFVQVVLHRGARQDHLEARAKLYIHTYIHTYIYIF